jgi:hypothetical protein
MSRMRPSNPRRDLSHILPPDRAEPRPLTAQEKKVRRQQRQDLIDTRGPPLTRDEKLTAEGREIRAALNAPPRLIKKADMETKSRVQFRRRPTKKPR